MADSNASLVLARVKAWNQTHPGEQLDPEAVLRVASGEGLSGGVGDRGTSFGPFQEHIGGALPAAVARLGVQGAQQWAWSPEGIDTALAGLARVAAGMTGDQAVQAMVYGYERPSNPAAEVARDTGINTAAAGIAVPPAPPGAPGGLTASLAGLLLQNGGRFPQAKTIKASFKNPVVKIETKPPPDLTNALTVARKYLDATRGGFSNAGFAQYVHGLRGVSLPGSAKGQLRASRPTGTPKAGDLVFRGGQHGGVMVDSQTVLHGGGNTLKVSGLAAGRQGGLVTVRTVDGANPVA